MVKRRFVMIPCLLIFYLSGCVRWLSVNQINTNGNDFRAGDGTFTNVFKEGDSSFFNLDAAPSRSVPGTWINISAGTFIMGSPADDTCQRDEVIHQVKLTNGFEILATEVTQGQYLEVRGYNPAFFTSCGSNCPVETINWHEAAAYCNALSAYRGYSTCYDCSGSGSAVTCVENVSYMSSNIFSCPGYRLPTEAEWEYAYRAGTTTSLHNNTNVVNCWSRDDNALALAWYNDNSSRTTHPVGSNNSPNTCNSWGICDMAGNVWEWVNDSWDNITPFNSSSTINPWGQSSASNRVIRGGSWDCWNPEDLRATVRFGDLPTRRDIGDFGFRCVRTN